MDTVISLLVLSTLLQLVTPLVPAASTLRAAVEVVSGESRIFSGESLRLRCSVPNDHRSSWNYLWFKGSIMLPHSGREFSLWNAKVKESGKFSCQGVRGSLVGKIHSHKSLPVEIFVDGGFAILQVPPHPSFVGNNLSMTCQVRHNPRVHERILYRDGVEVMRQSGVKPHLHLDHLTLEDAGRYSCRASWDVNSRTVSVVSAPVSVQIAEVLSEAVLEINANLQRQNMMKLICHIQYNIPPPAPRVHFYFYRNSSRLGTSQSENHQVVSQRPGLYSCKARVPQLDALKWSEPRSFE